MRQDNDLRTAANTIEWLIETRIKVLQYPVKVKRDRKKAVQKQLRPQTSMNWSNDVKKTRQNSVWETDNYIKKIKIQVISDMAALQTESQGVGYLVCHTWPLNFCFIFVKGVMVI